MLFYPDFIGEVDISRNVLMTPLGVLPGLLTGCAFLMFWKLSPRSNPLRSFESVPTESVPLPATYPSSDIFTYMCPSCHSFQKSDTESCSKCGGENPHVSKK
jgi:hypothetical protein